MHLIEEEYNYAGFWIRFLAYLIDGLILFFIFTVLITIFTGDPFYQFRIDPKALGSDYWSIVFSSWILNIMYYSGFESSAKQATPGKMIMGLRVIGLSGERITATNAIGRYLGKLLSAIPLLIGFIMAAFTAKKQALHDMLASTYVVYEVRRTE